MEWAEPRRVDGRANTHILLPHPTSPGPDRSRASLQGTEQRSRGAALGQTEALD